MHPFRSILTNATLAALLTVPAFAGDDQKQPRALAQRLFEPRVEQVVGGGEIVAVKVVG